MKKRYICQLSLFGIILRLLALPLFAALALLSALILCSKYLKNYLLYGGEAIIYTHDTQPDTIADLLNRANLQSVEPKGAPSPNLESLRPLTADGIRDVLSPEFDNDIDIRSWLNEDFLRERGFDSIGEMLEYKPECWPYGTLKVLQKYNFDVFEVNGKQP